MISILTGKNTARTLSVHSAIDISDMWRKSMGIDVGDIFRSIECISYCECTETGFRYYQPSLASGGGCYMSNLKNLIGTTCPISGSSAKL